MGPVKHSRSPQSSRRGAFTCVELLCILAVLGVVLAVLAVMGDKARKAAMLSDDLANFRQIAALTGQYAADNDDKFWTFSWQGGETYNTKWSDLKSGTDDVEAAANQAVVILRDHAGRLDMPKISPGWYSFLLYSHLPLQTYAGSSFPDRLFVSSGDRARLLWASDPPGFDQGKFLPNQPSPMYPVNKRWPYSSSYQLSTSFFDQGTPNAARVSQASPQENLWNTPNDGDLQARTLSATKHPSLKSHLHDKFAWHFGTTTEDSLLTNEFDKGYPFFAEEHARLPILFVDGHAAVHRSGNANKGWIPNAPCPFTPTSFVSPSSGKTVPGCYRWTRLFLDGADVGKPELDDCPK